MKKHAGYHDFRAKPVDNAFIDSSERLGQLKRQRTYWRKKMMIGEASIDHATPQLLAAAKQAEKEVKKPFYRRNKVVPKEGMPISVSRLPRAARQYSGGASDAYRGNIKLNPNMTGSKRGRTATVHELLHVTDPGQHQALAKLKQSAPSPGVFKTVMGAGQLAGAVISRIPRISQKASNLSGSSDADLAKYYSERREAHAYIGTAGTQGIQDLKNTPIKTKKGVRVGVKAPIVRDALRKAQLGDFNSISPAMGLFGDIEKLRDFNPQMRKTYRKGAKEINMGIEREYGSRNTTGGTINKFGHVKLARPISKLPEDVEEAVHINVFRPKTKRIQGEHKTAASVLPSQATFLGAGAEAAAYLHKATKNPSGWRVYRESSAPKRRGVFKRPNVPEVTQALDVKRIGNRQVEMVPYRIPAMPYASRRGREYNPRHPKGGHVSTDLIYNLANKGYLASDAHFRNIGLDPKTKKAELIDPGFLTKLDKKGQEKLHQTLRRVDPTSMSSASFRQLLHKEVTSEAFEEGHPQLGEASIDHVTPQLLNTAKKLERAYRKAPTDIWSAKGIGAKIDRFIGADEQNIGTFSSPGRTAKERRVVSLSATGLLGPNTHASVRHARLNSPDVKPSRKLARAVSNRRFIAMPLASTRSKEKNKDKNYEALVHELIHAHDPRNTYSHKGKDRARMRERIRFQTPEERMAIRTQRKVAGDPGYFAEPEEVHAYSASAGTLGVRGLQRGGVSVDSVRSMLRKAQPKWGEVMKNKDYAYQSFGVPVEHYGKMLKSSNRKHVKAARKFFKETHKGVERIYGERKRVIGDKRLLGVPVGRLPEELCPPPALQEGKVYRGIANFALSPAGAIAEGYQQTVGRHEQYGTRPQLAGQTGGDNPRSSLSPNAGEAAQRPTQQGRVMKRPTNVSRNPMREAIIERIIESALANASAAAKANTGGSMGTISNAGGTVTSTGKAGGGFGTQGSGAGRFSGGGQKFGSRATAAAGVKDVGYGGRFDGPVGNNGSSSSGASSAGGGQKTSLGGVGRTFTGGAGANTGPGTTGNVTGTTPSPTPPAGGKSSSGQTQSASGGSGSYLKPGGGANNNFKAITPGATANKSANAFSAGEGTSRKVVGVGGGDKTQHNKRDLNPGNISQSQRQAGSNIMHNQAARTGAPNMQRERAFAAGTGGRFAGGGPRPMGGGGSYGGGGSSGHSQSGYRNSSSFNIGGSVGFGGGSSRGRIGANFGSSRTSYGSRSSGW